MGIMNSKLGFCITVLVILAGGIVSVVMINGIGQDVEVSLGPERLNVYMETVYEKYSNVPTQYCWTVFNNRTDSAPAVRFVHVVLEDGIEVVFMSQHQTFGWSRWHTDATGLLQKNAVAFLKEKGN